MSASDVVLQTNVPGFPVRRGKVRDVYDLGERLLIVASDRLSAFDVVMPNGIPHKGRVLTRLSEFWFGLLGGIPNHLVEVIEGKAPPGFEAHLGELAGRAMLVRKVRIAPIECVVRGYLAGSGWKEYQQQGTVCGIKLPAGLRQCDQLPEPIFTPSTKAEVGHDENISFERCAGIVGAEVAGQLRDRSLEVYRKAAEYARGQGLIIADTKFEWGFDGDKLVLADEVLTPDSSRFWPADQYAPGRDQPSFDKQYVRNYLETLSWNKTPPGPVLPDDVVANTSKKYLEAYERITGKALRK